MQKLYNVCKGALILLLVILANSAFAQTTVTGKVSDDTGGLPGVSVSVNGTGTQTDMNGKYAIKASKGAILKFSFIGYKTQEVKVGDQTVINVTLVSTSGQLNELVVTALGISKEKRALGYAASTINSKDITEAGSPNFATALYGKAPGVRIAAGPGGATSAVNITIRGINSLTGSNQPLIVLDGVPIRNGEANNSNYWNDQRLRGNGLLDINPEDIENITVLKGASAAALYGSLATNGVLLITTKSGKGKKGFSVDVNANSSFDEVAFLPRYQNVRGPGIPKNVSDRGQDDEGFVYKTINGQQVRAVLGATINFGPVFDGKPTLSWDGTIRPYSAQMNNYKGLFRTADNSNINVAVTQASENSNVRFSVTRQSNQGVSLGAENTKNIANLNSSFQLSKKFSTDIQVNYINQYTHNRPYSIDRLMNNFTGMMGRFDNAAWYLDKYKTSQGYKYVTDRNQSLTPDENIIYSGNGFRSDIADYVWNVKEHNDDEHSDRVIANLTNNWQILNNLKLRARIATDFTSLRTESRQSTEIPLAFGNSGGFGLSSDLDNILYGDLLLTYTKKVTSDLELNLMGGYTASKETETYYSRSTNGGLSTENLFDIAASVNTPNSDSRRTSLVNDGLLGTINANYKGYLYVEGTMRRDRTSTMNPNNNAFFYPSVNSGFVFSDAFRLPAFISYGKLRASWGIVGHYPTAYQANIAYNQYNLGVQQVGGQSVLYTNIPANFGNDGIKPEQKHEYEFGLETKFLNNRLGLDVAYYNAQIVNQILPLSIPSSSGATSVFTNIGTLRNKGIEVAINGTPVKSRDFTWDAGINFAKNTNIVEKLSSGSTELLHADYDGNAVQLKSVVGQPMGDFYAHPVQTDSKGQLIVDPNGMYHVDPDKMVKVGNAMPKVIGGVFNAFTFKGITLNTMIDFRLGGYVMPTALNWMISRGLLEESLNHMDKAHGGLSYYQTADGTRKLTNAATGPGGEKVYNDGMLLPGVKTDGSKSDYIASSADYYWTVYNWGGPQYSPNTRYELYIKKNSYVKFREIVLSYKIPAHFTSNIGFKNVQLSVFGRNLFYLYRTIKDMDAEQLTAGTNWTQTLTNAGTNPSTRTYGAMLRANF